MVDDWHELLVRRCTAEADGVLSFELVDPAGADLVPWEPGAHIDVATPAGLVRQYSLCGDIEDHKQYRIAVLLDPNTRGGSRGLYETALVGRRLPVRGPKNHFQFVQAAGYLFLAGGIGVTPIASMIQAAEQNGTPWRLVYGGRTRSGMALVQELLARSGGSVLLSPDDGIGRPDFEAILSAAKPGIAIYCCGPEPMIAAVEALCERYLLGGMLHVERFTARGTVYGSERDRARYTDDIDDDDNDGSATFEVELARAGLVLAVPAGRTLLHVIRDALPAVLYSCEQGYCGTCETVVLAGVPDHRDTILTDNERAQNKTMMTCVSRSKSPRLVLDL